MIKIAGLLTASAIIGMASTSIAQEARAGEDRPKMHSDVCPSTPDPIPASALFAEVKRNPSLYDEKGEFETSASYESRRAEAVRKQFPGSTVSVAKKVPSYKISYDADRRLLSIDMARSDYYMTRSDLLVTELASDVVETGGYVGENRYGASRDVVRETVTEFVIAWGGGGAPVSGVKAYVNVDPDIARHLKDSAELVFVGSLVEPYVQKRYNYILPTMDSPTQRTVNSYAIFLKPTCAYLRGGSGQLYGLRMSQ